MICSRTPIARLVAIAACMVLLTLAHASADEEAFRFVSGLGTAVCGGEYPEAQAELDIEYEDGKTELEIEVEGAAPNTFYTVWLLLASGSPLTDLPFTALADPAEITALGDVTPSTVLTATANALGIVGDNGIGSAAVVNGFFTDSEGEGELELEVPFPLGNGAYPFQDFDASLDPVPIGLPIGGTSVQLLIASHCFSSPAGPTLLPNVGHGLVDRNPGDPDETWFLWP